MLVGPGSEGVGLLRVELVPLALGVLSLWLGQDFNYDLRNYHLYNAYAFLNGRLGQDLAKSIVRLAEPVDGVYASDHIGVVCELRVAAST